MNVPIGAQLWLFHQVTDEDEMRGILARLAEAGYACVETMYGKPSSSRTDLQTPGLQCYATHVALSALPPLTELADFAHRLGARVICVSGLLQWNERTADDYRLSAEALNTLGAQLHAEGLSLHYHNHEFEFAPVTAAATGMDLLLAGLDPAAVSLCFDAGWAAIAGQNPEAFLKEHRSRIGTVHLRDFREKASVSLGAGDMALSPLLETLPLLPNLQAVLVEQDPGTADPIGDMIASYRFLQAARASMRA